MKIEWSTPPLRRGFNANIDKLIGPGATAAEKYLQSIVPLLAAGVLLACVYLGQWDWQVWQVIIAVILTVDIVGGIITNATSTAKLWFHRTGQGLWQHMQFISIHFAQLALFSWAFLQFDIQWILVAGGYMLLASMAILLTNLYLQRPVALIFYASSIVLSSYYLTVPAGLEWFLPLFYLKLLISHLLREEPYRPNAESL